MSAVNRAADGTYTPGRGLPLGLPTRSSDDPLSTQVSAEFSQSREPNASLFPHPSVLDRPASPRVGKRLLSVLARRLSERDFEVLRLVAEHRFLTTHQVQSFCFLDHESEASAARTTRRVLARLERDGLLRALDRRVGGVRAGSEATIWQLAPAGSRLIHGDEKRRRADKPSDRFLTHQLAIADVHVLLRQHKRIEAIEDITVEVEPASWRRYQGIGGEPRWLQPDLYAEITTSEFIDRLFIEVDLGSESIPTLVRKCQQYEDYRRSGIEQDRTGGFPLVLWLFVDPLRAIKLQMLIERSSKLTAAMYRYATPETLTQVLAGGTA